MSVDSAVRLLNKDILALTKRLETLESRVKQMTNDEKNTAPNEPTSWASAKDAKAWLDQIGQIPPSIMSASRLTAEQEKELLRAKPFNELPIWNLVVADAAGRIWADIHVESSEELTTHVIHWLAKEPTHTIKITKETQPWSLVGGISMGPSNVTSPQKR